MTPWAKSDDIPYDWAGLLVFYYSTDCHCENHCGYVALCKTLDESWQPTFITGYLLCPDDR